MKATVLPDSRQMRCSSRFIASRVIASSAPNGSSISSSAGSWTSARASATRCRMPPDSSCGYLSSNPVRPTSARSSSARRRYVARSSRSTTTGSITFSSTVRHGSNTGSWNTIPTLRLGPLMRRPSSSTLPDEAARRPPRMRSNVVFPQPEGPTIVTNSPSAMLSVTSASARIREPARVRYVFSTRETAINGAPIPGIWCGAGPSRARGDRRSTV